MKPKKLDNENPPPTDVWITRLCKRTDNLECFYEYKREKDGKITIKRGSFERRYGDYFEITPKKEDFMPFKTIRCDSDVTYESCKYETCRLGSFKFYFTN